MSRNLLQNNPSMQAISTILPINESSIFHQQSKKDLFYKIKVNTPHGQTKQNPPPIIKEESRIEESKETINKQPYNTKTTGFDINRQIYSDQQIREAFNTIDINKDGFLSFDDISFFLKCMRQPHTKQQVEEMIRMVSNNSDQVVLQDFRKIGKGLLIPVGSLKMPDVETEFKHEKLANIKQSTLYNDKVKQIFQIQQIQTFSYQAFKLQSQNQHLDPQIKFSQKLQKVEENVLMMRTREDIISKIRQMMSLSIDNLDHILYKLNHYSYDYIEVKDIVALLNIPDSKVRSIFFDKSNKVHIKRVILDSILFSRKTVLERLQHIMLNYNKKESLHFEQWRDILVFMVGIQQKQVIEKKLNNLLRGKKLNHKSLFDKYFILNMMNEEFSLFDL